jgi:hypothetical protein
LSPGFAAAGAAGLAAGEAGDFAGAGAPGLREVNTAAQCGHLIGLPTSLSGTRNGFLQLSQLMLVMPGVVLAAGAGLPGLCAWKTAEHNGHLIDLPTRLSWIVSGFWQVPQMTTVVVGAEGLAGGAAGAGGLAAGGVGLEAAGAGAEGGFGAAGVVAAGAGDFGAAGGVATVWPVLLALVGVCAAAGGFAAVMGGVKTAEQTGHFTGLPSREAASVSGRLQLVQGIVTVATCGGAAGFGAVAAGVGDAAAGVLGLAYSPGCVGAAGGLGIAGGADLGAAGAAAAAGFAVPFNAATNTIEHSGHLIDLPIRLSGTVRFRLQRLHAIAGIGSPATISGVVLKLVRATSVSRWNPRKCNPIVLAALTRVKQKSSNASV